VRISVFEANQSRTDVCSSVAGTVVIAEVDGVLTAYRHSIAKMTTTESIIANGFIPGPQNQPIFIRPCYRDLERLVFDLWTQPVDEQRHALLLGITGVGKTLFLRYMLWAILQRRRERAVAIHLLISTRLPGSADVAFMILASSTSVQVHRTSCSISLWPREAVERYTLADDCNPVDTVSAWGLQVSSPHLLHHRYFERRPGVETLQMPGWSLEELLRVREVRYPRLSEDIVRQRYRMVGGLARLVLGQPFKDPTEWISVGFRLTSIDALMRGIETYDKAGSQRLLHFTVETCGPAMYRSTRPMFASRLVRDEVTKHLKQSHQQYASWLCDKARDSTYVPTLRDELLQDWVVQRLCEGGRFRWRRADALNDEPELYRIDAGLALREVYSLHELQQAPDDALVRPLDRSFGGIHLVRQRRDLFIATSDSGHPLLEPALTSVAACMRSGQEPLRLIWMVPRVRYAGMRLQRLHDGNGRLVDEDKLPEVLRSMEQYVLEVPLVDLRLMAHAGSVDDNKDLDDDELALPACGVIDAGEVPCQLIPVGVQRRCDKHRERRVSVEGLRSYLTSRNSTFEVPEV